MAKPADIRYAVVRTATACLGAATVTTGGLPGSRTPCASQWAHVHDPVWPCSARNMREHSGQEAAHGRSRHRGPRGPPARPQPVGAAPDAVRGEVRGAASAAVARRGGSGPGSAGARPAGRTTRLGAVLVAQVTRFRTQRPTFADNNLFQQLQSSGVPVNANPPDAGAPVWQQLAAPTLYRPEAGAADHVRGRGGHRRGQERGHRDRRASIAEPEKFPKPATDGSEPPVAASPNTQPKVNT